MLLWLAKKVTCKSMLILSVNVVLRFEIWYISFCVPSPNSTFSICRPRLIFTFLFYIFKLNSLFVNLNGI